jgi:pimeloyl-ACP methyl ester carboxylesterase
VAAIQLGNGPKVLLVHGWEGEVGDFSAFLPGLLEAGYGVIALDLPAHGASEGTTASISACVRSVLEVQRVCGELHAVIGHSVGCLIAAQAAGMGLDTKRMVLLCSPARYEDCARRFASRAGLDLKETEEMLVALEAMGAEVRSISLPAVAPRLRQKALFIHSKDDAMIPVSDGLESALAWPESKFVEVDGLGHRRILRSPEVCEEALKFVSG